MLVRDLQESNREQRIFRGRVLEKVFINDSVCRVRLADELGDVVYCLLQGVHWSEKIKDFKETQKIILAPSKIITVPAKYNQFYRPEILGTVVSPLIFHYNVHDFDLKFREDCSVAKYVEGFQTINSINEQLCNCNFVRSSIIGVIIDFYNKPDVSNSSAENFYRIKLVDSSIELLKHVNLNVYLRKNYNFRKVSIGDVVIVQGVNFKIYQSRVMGIYNVSSGNFAILSWVDGKIEFCTENFVLSDNMMTEFCGLQNWIFNNLQYQKLMLNHFLSRSYEKLGIYDKVFYLIQILHDFPESGQSTLIFGDPYKLAYLVILTQLISHVESPNWVKLSQIKINENKIEMLNNSSLVIVPEWAPIIKSLPPPTSSVIKEVMLQFSQKIGRDLTLTINHKHTQQPTLNLHSLLDPSDQTLYTRLKALVIDFHPRTIGYGIHKENSRLVYSGLIKLYSSSEILTVFVFGKSSNLFYNINETDSYSTIITKIEKIQNNLLNCFGLVEFGLKRLIKDNTVYLVLSETEIKYFD